MKIFNGEILHYINETLFFLLMVCFLFSITEIAFRYGRHKAKKTRSDYSSQAAGFGGTLLGLLALLLGFAFSMSIGRFDNRKQLLSQEANDIQTAYLKADFLPSDASIKMKSMLAEYTQLRIDYYKVGTLEVEMYDNLKKTSELQKYMWKEAMYILHFENDSQYSEFQTMTFLSALNLIFDDQMKRTVARTDHVPEAILWLLIFVAAIALSITSYSLGLKNAKLLLSRIVLALAVSSVLTIILDLDRPIRGIIQINQQSMIDTHEMIVKEIANTGK